jgi:hypothetical protein
LLGSLTHPNLLKGQALPFHCVVIFLLRPDGFGRSDTRQQRGRPCESKGGMATHCKEESPGLAGVARTDCSAGPAPAAQLLQLGHAPGGLPADVVAGERDLHEVTAEDPGR